MSLRLGFLMKQRVRGIFVDSISEVPSSEELPAAIRIPNHKKDS